MSKRCPRCKTVKPMEAFTTKAAPYCRPCTSHYMKFQRPGCANKKREKLRENVINAEYRRGEFSDKLAGQWSKVKLTSARFRHV